MVGKRKSETVSNIPAKCSRVDEVQARGNSSLMRLNEIGIKGLKWIVEQVNTTFPQKFKGMCLFTEPFSTAHEVISSGTAFVSEGSSKSSCRHDIADQIMNRLTNKNVEIAPTVVTDYAQDIETPTKEFSKINADTLSINDAVRYLNEKVPDIDYEFTLDTEGYHCNVNYKGSVIQGLGSSKKKAKHVVALEILDKYFNLQFTDNDDSLLINIDCATKEENDKLIFNRRKKFSNQIQSMVKNGFEKLVNTLEVQNSKRKVLSGIVISRKLVIVFPKYGIKVESSEEPTTASIDPLQFYTETGWTLNPNDNSEILKLVTISSGSKCLSNHEVNTMGNYLNDCHAEVITKRAFQYFLHQTIDRLVKKVQITSSNENLNGCDILEIFSQDDTFTYKMKEDVKLHLYVSCAPCGDSRIWLPETVAEEKADESEANNEPPAKKLCGLLRTKIECGEGTIPTKINRSKTWDGILNVEPLPTMSCSDKICTWNVLGLQGALLSNVLSEPIYLDSIIIGSLVQSKHSEKSFFLRASNVIEESDWSCNLSKDSNKCDIKHESDIEQGELKRVSKDTPSFRVNTPHILTVTDQDERCTGKSSNFSFNWILGEDSFEVISSNKGLKLDDSSSRLSKRSLLLSFLSVFRWLPFIFPDSGMFFYSDLKKLVSYPDNAIGAVNYRHKKSALVKHFEKQGLGQWVSHKHEQNCFTVYL